MESAVDTSVLRAITYLAKSSKTEFLPAISLLIAHTQATAEKAYAQEAQQIKVPEGEPIPEASPLARDTAGNVEALLGCEPDSTPNNSPSESPADKPVGRPVFTGHKRPRETYSPRPYHGGGSASKRYLMGPDGDDEPTPPPRARAPRGRSTSAVTSDKPQQLVVRCPCGGGSGPKMTFTSMEEAAEFLEVSVHSLVKSLKERAPTERRPWEYMDYVVWQEAAEQDDSSDDFIEEADIFSPTPSSTRTPSGGGGRGSHQPNAKAVIGVKEGCDPIRFPSVNRAAAHYHMEWQRFNTRHVQQHVPLQGYTFSLDTGGT